MPSASYDTARYTMLLGSCHHPWSPPAFCARLLFLLVVSCRPRLSTVTVTTLGEQRGSTVVSVAGSLSPRGQRQTSVWREPCVQVNEGVELARIALIETYGRLQSENYFMALLQYAWQCHLLPASRAWCNDIATDQFIVLPLSHVSARRMLLCVCRSIF